MKSKIITIGLVFIISLGTGFIYSEMQHPPKDSLKITFPIMTPVTSHQFEVNITKPVKYYEELCKDFMNQTIYIDGLYIRCGHHECLEWVTDIDNQISRMNNCSITEIKIR